MIAALIFAISIVTLLQFFVSYSRSLIAECRDQELSEQTREICGVTARSVAGDEFRKLSELIAMCPESGSDGSTLIAVSAYYRLLGIVRSVANWASPAATAWIESERCDCAWAAAVVLDRRIAYTRMMMTQQSSH